MRVTHVIIGSLLVIAGLALAAPPAAASHACGPYEYYYGIDFGYVVVQRVNPSLGVHTEGCLGFVTCTSSGLPCAGFRTGPGAHSCVNWRAYGPVGGEVCLL